ncbi:hypothetical protein FRB96_006970 [Tulasnella sp. 330]|nr:hypothetical protein FRB96_006970 [Tulasnella sp. 330]
MSGPQKVASSPSAITLPPPYETVVSGRRPGSAANPPSPSTSAGGIWTSFVRVITGEGPSGVLFCDILSMQDDRSSSRGRDFASTGRGGAGNVVRSASASRDVRAEDGDERGREVFVNGDRVTHAGRGGQGNIRSPSRDPAQVAQERAFEEAVIRKRREEREAQPASSGRGGTGNISADRSRSRSRDPNSVAAETGLGRGGAGNIEEARHFRHLGHGELETIDDEERTEEIRNERIFDKTRHNGPHTHLGHLL